MGNLLLERIRKKDKKKLFDATHTSVSYPTGFLPFDYKNGYVVSCMDDNEQLICQYNNLGIVGGTFVTIIGKSGVAKTTYAVQMSSAMVKPYENAFVVHVDLEQTLTYTRIKAVNKFTQRELKDKYVLKQEKCYIEDIFDMIVEICNTKEEDKDAFTYESKFKDEFNNPVRLYVPTVIIVDSIPTTASKDSKSEMEGSTYANRKAKALSQFYQRAMPLLKQYNITVIAINHINAKIEINAFAKTQPQLLYLKADESMPGGNAPIYYANNIFKFIAEGKNKYNMEDDGFDGVKIRCELLKSRTNKAGQFCHLIYNQARGFSEIMTLFSFCIDNGLVLGARKNSRYFKGHEDIKFDMTTWVKFEEEFLSRQDVRFAMHDVAMPLLEKDLSRCGDDNSQGMTLLEIIERIEASQDNEDSLCSISLEDKKSA